MKVSFNTMLGIVTLRNIMIEDEFNYLEEGVELTGEKISTLEIIGYIDLDTIDSKDVENLIFKHI